MWGPVKIWGFCFTQTCDDDPEPPGSGNDAITQKEGVEPLALVERIRGGSVANIWYERGAPRSGNGCCFNSVGSSCVYTRKLIAVDEQADDNVVHYRSLH
jgi:chitodextrinase